MASYVRDHGFSTVECFVGHGIGREMHEEPQVPNFLSRSLRGSGDFRIEPGLVIAVEPMVNMGTKRVKMLRDHWTQIDARRQAERPFRAHDRRHRPTAQSLLTVAPTPAEARAVGACEGISARGVAGARRAGGSLRQRGDLPTARRPANFCGSSGLEGRRRAAGILHGSHVPACCVESVRHESQSQRQANLRQVQGRPPPRRGVRRLQQPAPQAAAGLDVVSGVEFRRVARHSTSALDSQ